MALVTGASGATGPRRALGLVATTSVVVGSVVGSGIFLTPAIVAQHVGSWELVLVVWTLGGLLTLAAALTAAELGAMFPRAGGEYVFLREAYGDAPAFLFGWMALAVNYSGTIAAVAAAFGIYLGTVLGFGGFGLRLAAIALIWALTLVNVLGVRHSGAVQVGSTVAKILALAGLVVLGLLLGRAWGDGDLVVRGDGIETGSAIMLGLVAALFAFDGILSATIVGEEVKDPARTLPRATIWGTLIITGVYLLVNAAFLNVLPMQRLAGNDRAAFDVGDALGGTAGAVLVALAILVATFGTVNGYVLQSPRIYYGMARDGLLYRSFGRLSPTRGTPVFGLILQAEWSSILVLSGTYDQLITYVVVSSWLFYGLTGMALFRLRRTRPEASRPYRAWGYPWVPAVFVASAALIVVVSIVLDPRDALIGVGLALSGVPVYAWLRWRSRAGAAPKTPS